MKANITIYFYDILAKIAKRLEAYFIYKRRKIKPYSDEEIHLFHIVGTEVVAGNFKGMKYPSAKSFGSSFFPKIIGTYENEIQGFLKYLLTSNSYNEIYDVGCAEGYYAVGIALFLNKNNRVLAYDINPVAKDLTKQMALLNNVSNQVIINGEFHSNQLSVSPEQRRFFLIDCEGYEKYLFSDDDIVNRYCNDDLLIETHDFIDYNISLEIEKKLVATHYVFTQNTIGDFQKVKYYFTKFSELETNLNLKHLALSEGRPTGQEWIIALSKLHYSKNELEKLFLFINEYNNEIGCPKSFTRPNADLKVE